MQKIQSILKNSMFFANKTSISMFVLAFGSTGYFISRYNTDEKLKHPIVEESLNKLEQNTQIIELVGYPITIETSMKTRAQINETNCQFMFIVKGPKGYLNVDLGGEAEIHKNLKTQNDEVKRKYSILDTVIQKKLLNQTEDYLEKLPIEDTDKFWKIDFLFAELGGQYRINIFPPPNQNEKGQITDNNKNKQQVSSQNEDKNNQLRQNYQIGKRETLKDLLIEYKQRFKESSQNTVPISDLEMEEQRKFKQGQFYKKLGYIRFYMFLMFFLGTATIYVYVQKNKRISVLGSQIHMMTEQLLMRNPFVQKNFGQKIKFSKQLRGGQIGKKAEFELDIMGVQKFGFAKVQGTLQEDNDMWKIEQIEVFIKNEQGGIVENKKLI